ncbi:hypothetical protein L0152_15275 [bacterium]|nr:hypothetical protein [bacterium]
MNKKNIFLFLFVLLLTPVVAFSGTIERYCFQEPGGTFYDMRGGKLGKKAYTLQVTNVFCSGTPLTGIATFAKLSSGYSVTMLVSRDPSGTCQSYQVSTLTDNFLTALNGNFDNLPRQFPPDGNFSATRVACPGPFITVEVGKPGPGPAAGKASE